MNLLKDPRFLYHERLYNKLHLNLATEVLKDFSLNVFDRFYVTDTKSSGNGYLEPKSELINNLLQGSSERYACQLRQLMGRIASSIFFVGS